MPVDEVKLLVPVARPSKILLLAGNYAAHVVERGGTAAERAETFPYVFMKPPTTTMTHPGDPIRIPAVSPDHVDWECELGVVIGRHCRDVEEDEALDYVAGYTVVNDITDRKFTPNPGRKPRERDRFFDWLHGKWHDTFCPIGPCLLSADAVPDPQALPIRLTVNGETKQDGNTGQMIFPVAAVISFLSRFVTLEPGDLISTGTPSGVGSATGTYLKPGRPRRRLDRRDRRAGEPGRGRGVNGAPTTVVLSCRSDRDGVPVRSRMPDDGDRRSAPIDSTSTEIGPFRSRTRSYEIVDGQPGGEAAHGRTRPI